MLVVVTFLNGGSGEGGEGEASAVAPWGSLIVDSATSVSNSAAATSTPEAPAVPATTTRRPALVLPVYDLATTEGQLKAAQFRRDSLSTSTDELFDDLAADLSDACPANATDAALESLFEDL